MMSVIDWLQTKLNIQSSKPDELEERCYQELTGQGTLGEFRNKKWIPECCVGERCKCGEQARHKLEEVVFDDDPCLFMRHPFTAYVCDGCFARVMFPDSIISSGE